MVILCTGGFSRYYIWHSGLYQTPAGKIAWDRFVLRLPHHRSDYPFEELSRACRTIAMLIKVGLPLPDYYYHVYSECRQ